MITHFDLGPAKLASATMIATLVDPAIERLMFPFVSVDQAVLGPSVKDGWPRYDTLLSLLVVNIDCC